MTRVRIGVVCALPDEIGMFSSTRLSQGDILSVETNLLVAVAGMGQECAGIMAERLADQGVSLLISWGFAGSVSSAADRSQILLPKQITTENENYPVDELLWQQCYPALCSEMDVNKGNIFTANEIIRTVPDKTRLREAYQVDSVDMESAAIARVAKARNIKTLVIRAVTDRSTHTIPDAIGEQTTWWTALMSLVYRPKSVVSLVKLGVGYKRALVSLGRARVSLYNEFSLGPV